MTDNPYTHSAEAIEKIVLGPDDRLVLRVRHELDRHELDEIRKVLDRVLGPDRAVVIIDPDRDVDLDVVGPIVGDDSPRAEE